MSHSSFAKPANLYGASESSRSWLPARDVKLSDAYIDAGAGVLETLVIRRLNEEFSS